MLVPVLESDHDDVEEAELVPVEVLEVVDVLIDDNTGDAVGVE